jgi:hypothetical protein
MRAIADLIDLDRYPLHAPGSAGYRDLVAHCQAMHRDEACANLPGFLRADALALLAEEARDLLKHGYQKSHLRTAMFDHGDPTKPADHPARRMFREGSLQLADDQIGETMIRAIYEWQPLTGFIAAVEQKDRLYRMADEFQALNIIQQSTGDGLPWHFDVNAFTITLLLQASEEGGDFVFVPEMRDGAEVDFDTMAKLFDGDESMVRRPNRQAGTLTLFRGRNAFHAVTPVTGRTPRITAILTYDERPDCVSSERGNTFVYGPRVEAIYRKRRSMEAGS